MAGSMVVYLVGAIEAHAIPKRRTVKIEGQIAFVKEFHKMPRPIQCYNYEHPQNHRTDSCPSAETKCPACADAHATGRDDKTITSCRKDGSRTLHGWITREFPNCFWGEKTEHLAYVIAECEKRSVHTVEPTAQAEED
ncbi:hypothetical protein AYO21_09262 [Fonsecaea monophora]|uniref:Uncharacterized protein n=1 Tax=Fonsecaea monophora TaxID=254056 RepID=A0A177EYS7_9EURO|nr:hypothetical protein AYO21_09262 [Fonsecaea monophora]OAG36531.1 hypothetical protein AYO21_09262 [Fonsecaea monophora]